MDDLDGGGNPYTPPLSLLFDKDQWGKVRINQQVRKDAAATVNRVLRERLGGQHLPADFRHPVMQRGLNQWVGGELQQAVEQLTSTLAQVRFVDQVITALSGRASEQRKALRRKGVLWTRIGNIVAHLQEWGKWAAAMDQAGYVQGWEEGVTELIGWANAAKPDEVIKGECGLIPSAASAEDASMAQLAHQVWTLRLQQARAREEMQLVAEEKVALVDILSKQVAVLTEGAAAPGPEAVFYLRELHRLQAILMHAQGAFGMAPSGINAEVAALVASTYGDNEDVGTL
jgi:hypothetical protein